MTEIRITPSIDPETGVQFLNTSVNGNTDTGMIALDQRANAAACRAEILWLGAMVSAIESPHVSSAQRNEFLALTGMEPSTRSRWYPGGAFTIDDTTYIRRIHDLLAQSTDIDAWADRNTRSLTSNSRVSE